MKKPRWIARILDRSVPLCDARYDAQGWDTCAVGEVVNDFPDVVLLDLRENEYRSRRAIPPADKTLDHLGKRFSVVVAQGDRKAALKIYDRIQTRVRTLMRKKRA